jgi:hypothetical protein
MIRFLLFECLTPEARIILVACAPRNWEPPHDDTFGSPRVHLAVKPAELEEERLEREVAPVMRATPGEVKHKWPVEK